tara:strand:+ start:1945 stop:2322 length:378 start_codon:yes stop_codon:yes gene_type:complete
MKLIYCNNCRDVISLSKTTKTCQCGESGGHYKTYGLDATIYGNCKLLGFDNSTFEVALATQPAWGKGRDFTAYVIPVQSPTVSHVDLEDYEGIGINDIADVFDELVDPTEIKIKKNKIKNVFKDE